MAGARRAKAHGEAVDGIVYFGLWNRAATTFYALDARTGVARWTFNAFDGAVQFDDDRLIYASPTVVDGAAYVIGWLNNLYAIDTG